MFLFENIAITDRIAKFLQLQIQNDYVSHFS